MNLKNADALFFK